LPTKLDGCVLWLRSDLGITLNGSDVSAWADQSGNGNDATQAVAANQPAYLAAGGVNGTPGLDFDAVTEYLDLLGFTEASTDYTLHMVLNDRSVATSTLLANNGGTFRYRAYRAGLLSLYDGANNDGPAQAAGAQSQTWLLDDTGNTTDWYRDGSWLLQGTYNTGRSHGGAGSAIGAVVGGGQYLNAIVSEVVYYNRTLNAAELTNLHAYSNGRYGL
jgi:hypothetical protein